MQIAMNQVVRLPVQLGAIVQTERLRRNLTQAELAVLVGTQQKTISAIENGNAGTRLDTILAVIGCLDLDLQVIYGRRGPSIQDVF